MRQILGPGDFLPPDPEDFDTAPFVERLLDSAEWCELYREESPDVPLREAAEQVLEWVMLHDNTPRFGRRNAHMAWDACNAYCESYERRAA